MPAVRVHHVSFTVSNLERTIAFYRDLLGFRLVGLKHRKANDLGSALLGPTVSNDNSTEGEIQIADMQLGDCRVEFIQYITPPSANNLANPNLIGAAHIAIETENIESEYERLRAAGVRFHSPPRTVCDPGRPIWKWCYFRDPDGICVELVESCLP